MAKTFFITGTDTGVGKTTVACALARAFKAKGLTVGVMKPVETGCSKKEGKLVPADAVKLKKAASSLDPVDLINPYRFSQPLAPSIAAQMTGTEISLEKIKDFYDAITPKKDIIIVEGAGGLLVPLTATQCVADLIKYLNVPTIVVAASKLGCINQTLLTVKYARKLRIEVSGIVLNHPTAERDDSQAHNLGVISKLCDEPLMKKLPFQKEGEFDLTWFIAGLI